MIAVIQRVKTAAVTVGSEVSGHIRTGLVILVGVAEGDSEADLDYLIRKIVNLRIFADEEGKMNRSALETQAEILVVSQFTLLADCRKGNRPSFDGAAAPRTAEGMYEEFVARMRAEGLAVATGVFGAMMDVMLVNDGPVTMIVDSRQKGKWRAAE